MNTLRLILGDQLNHQHSWYDDPNDDTIYVIAEMRQETDYVKHHIQKIVAFFDSMRNFAEWLKEQQHNVVYFQLDDPENKQDLIEFVKRNSISFREDSTNSDLSIPRNFLRQTILEPWEKKVPSLLKGIQGSVEHFIEWMDSLDHFIYHNLVPKVIQSDNQFQIQLNEIKTMPNMTKVRLVQILLKEYDNAPWTKHEIEQLKTFFQNDEIGHQHILPNGWKILKDRDSIFGQKMPKEMEIKGVELMPGHPVDFDKYRYELHVLKLSKYDSTLDNEKVDWTLLKGQKLELRIWENGDSFQPLGMDGHQKISDFLTNEKVNRFAKENQAVLTANGTIVWVCGKRIADWVKLTPNTTETAILNRSQLVI